MAQQANEPQSRRCCRVKGWPQSRADNSQHANPSPPMATVRYIAKRGRSNQLQTSRVKSRTGQLIKLATNNEQGLRKNRITAGDLAFSESHICLRRNHRVSVPPISCPNNSSTATFIQPKSGSTISTPCAMRFFPSASRQIRANYFFRADEDSQKQTVLSEVDERTGN